MIKELLNPLFFVKPFVFVNVLRQREIFLKEYATSLSINIYDETMANAKLSKTGHRRRSNYRMAKNSVKRAEVAWENIRMFISCCF